MWDAKSKWGFSGIRKMVRVVIIGVVVGLIFPTSLLFAVEVDTTTFHSGKGSLKIVSTKTGTEKAKWVIVSQTVEVKERQGYEFQAWMRQENTKQAHIKVYFYDGIGNRVGSVFLPLHSRTAKEITDSWQLFKTGRRVIPTGAVKVVIQCMGGWSGDGENPGISWFDDISLEPFEVKNGGFEEELSGWHYGEVGEVVFECDFETGDSGPWRILKPNVVSITDDPEEVISGKYSLKIDFPSSDMAIELKKDVDIESIFKKRGRYYSFSFDYYIIDKKPGTFMNWRVPLRDGRLFLAYGACRFAKPGDKGRWESRCWIGLQNSPTTIDVWLTDPMTIIVDNIQIKSIVPPKKAPPAPKIISPPEGMNITYTALSFKWRTSDYAIKSELQLAKDKRFEKDVKKVTVIPTRRGRKGRLATYKQWGGAAEILGVFEGKWYWRVREINEWGQKSKWSDIGVFTINKDLTKSPPCLKPSSRRPLFVLNHNWHPYKQSWQSLPSDLKPYCVLMIVKDLAGHILAQKELFESNNIPFILYMHMDIRSLTLTELEYIYQKMEGIKGIRIGEMYGVLNREHIEYALERYPEIIRLNAKYGKIVILSETTCRGKNWWIDWGLDKNLYQVTKEYSDYVIPTTKGSVPQYTLHNQDVVWGYWITDTVKNWGIAPESWYWRNAGYGQEQHGGKVEKPIPPTLFAQWFMINIVRGATCYYLEPHWHIWSSPGKHAPVWEKGIEPIFREIVKQGLIPEKEEVRKKVKVACLAQEEDGSDWGRKPFVNYGRFGKLYEGVYKVSGVVDLIPQIDRFYFMPVLPFYTPKEKLTLFPHLITTTKFNNAQEVRGYFNLYYPERREIKGNAWICNINDAYFISCTEENPKYKDLMQDYSIDLNHLFIKRIKGRVGLYQYLIVKKTPDGVHIHTNGRSNTQGKIIIAAQKPEGSIVVEEEPKGVLKKMWDKESQKLILEITYPEEGAVNLDVSMSGGTE